MAISTRVFSWNFAAFLSKLLRFSSVTTPPPPSSLSSSSIFLLNLVAPLPSYPYAFFISTIRNGISYYMIKATYLDQLNIPRMTTDLNYIYSYRHLLYIYYFFLVQYRSYNVVIIVGGTSNDNIKP